MIGKTRVLLQNLIIFFLAVNVEDVGILLCQQILLCQCSCPVVRQKCTYGNGCGGIVIWGSSQEMYVITYSLRVLD